MNFVTPELDAKMCKIIDESQKKSVDTELIKPLFEIKLNTESISEVTDTNLFDKGPMTEEKLTPFENEPKF